jgi:hypothetical protein
MLFWHGRSLVKYRELWKIKKEGNKEKRGKLRRKNN